MIKLQCNNWRNLWPALFYSEYFWHLLKRKLWIETDTYMYLSLTLGRMRFKEKYKLHGCDTTLVMKKESLRCIVRVCSLADYNNYYPKIVLLPWLTSRILQRACTNFTNKMLVWCKESTRLILARFKC